MSRNKLFRSRVAWALVALVAVVTLTSSIAPAQVTTPRVDLFGGYSWMHPGGRVAVPGSVPPLGNATTFLLGNQNLGWDGAVAYNFNKWVALEGDFGKHYCSEQGIKATFPPLSNSPIRSGVCFTPDILTAMAGPRLAFRTAHLTPFVHILAGTSHMTMRSTGLNGANGFSGSIGGGLDLWLLRNRLAVRLIQADFMNEMFRTAKVGGSGSFQGARVQGGFVVGLGAIKPPVAPTGTCSVTPASLMAGEPVTATMTTQNFNPKHKLQYEWNTTGGKLTAKDQTANIDTTGMSPGSYTVGATATDPKANKKFNSVKCDGQSFTINEPPKHPPTLACAASPKTVRSGDPVTITGEATNPDKREKLTYDWKTSAGHLTGTGTSVTLDTAGAPAGPITVSGTVTDDRGLSASCDATVNVEVPPPPPTASKLNEIAFPNEKKPWRVDNTAKAILDDVALRLQREPDAKAVVIGNVDPDEKGGVVLAQQRAVNTKAYLTEEKGIDAKRIDVRTGTAGGKRAEIYIVPAGATFNVAGTQDFNEKSVKSPADKKAPAKKGAAKAKTPAA